MSREQTAFKITVPHKVDDWRHDWYFPNGWRGIGPVEKRDRAARRVGKRSGYFPDWFVLACNNPNCPGRAVVPVWVVTDFADRMDEQGTAS